MENKNHDQTFQSKVDTWLILVLAGAVGAGWFSLARRMWTGRPIDGLDVIVPLVVSALIIWVYSTTYYEVTADELIVRSGQFARPYPSVRCSDYEPHTTRSQRRRCHWIGSK